MPYTFLRQFSMYGLLIFATSCDTATSSNTPTPDLSYEKGLVQANVPIGYWLDIQVGYFLPDGSIKDHLKSGREIRVFQYHTNGTLVVYSHVNDTIDRDTSTTLFYPQKNYYTWFNSVDQSRIDYTFSGETLMIRYDSVYQNHLIPYDGTIPPISWGIK